MFPIEPLLIVALVSGSPEQSLLDHKSYLPFNHALRGYCMRHELLDPQEMSHYFVNSSSFLSDLRAMRNRYGDLRDAPPISDVIRFPPRHEVVAMIDFNRQYRAAILARSPGLIDGPPRHIDSVLGEIDILHDFWAQVRDAQNRAYYIHTRRKSLYAAYRMLEEHDYYNGVYPPSVPLWRFRRID